MTQNDPTTPEAEFAQDVLDRFYDAAEDGIDPQALLNELSDVFLSFCIDAMGADCACDWINEFAADADRRRESFRLDEIADLRYLLSHPKITDEDRAELQARISELEALCQSTGNVTLRVN